MSRTIIKLAAAAAISTAVITGSILSTTPAQAVVLQEQKNAQQYTTAYLQSSLEDSMFEVKAGELAKEKASMQTVKDFGQTLVTDHTDAIAQIKSVATAKNITLNERITDKQQKMYDMLSAKSGSDFDKAFTEHMVKGHEAAIHKAEEAAKKVDDPAVKDLAEKSIVKFKEHLETAKNLWKAVK